MLIINPGARIGETAEGWTNTVETARAEAERWLQHMHEEGILDVELLPDVQENDGRWIFRFRHKVTGVVITLETHGIDNMEAYCKRYTFSPKTYWKGSSVSNPELEQWAAPGFRPVQTFAPLELEEK